MQVRLQRTTQTCDSLAAIQPEDTLDGHLCELLNTVNTLRHEHEEQANDLSQARAQVLQYTEKAEAEAKALVTAAEVRLQSEVTDLTSRIQSTARELREATDRLDRLLAYRDHLVNMRN